MKPFKIISVLIVMAMLAGCCSHKSPQGPDGPEIVSRGYATESGSYAEVGVKFSTTGDFVALVNPNRWKNPVKTGGSLSWLNPGAWSEDAGRTGRILLGEAAFVGGAVAGYAIGSNSGGGDSSSSGSAGDPAAPPSGPPSGGGPVGPGL